MLPASQMSHAVMPERQTCESILIVTSPERNGIGGGHRKCNASVQRQSSLVGMSQPSQRVAHPVPHCIPLPEHNLRRKTPRATVEAGYDGSHIHSFPRPPLKQLILPAPFNLKSTSWENRIPVSLEHCNYWNHAALSILFRQAIPTQASSLPYLGTPSDEPSTFHSPGNSIQPVVVEYPHIDQSVVRANDHNVRTFCPPPLPCRGSLVLGQKAWHSEIAPSNYLHQDQTHYSGPGCVSQKWIPAFTSIAIAPSI